MGDIANKKYYGFEKSNTRPAYPQNSDTVPPTVNPPDTNPPGSMSALGVKLNRKTFGGVKRVIETNDLLEIPINWQYNVYASSAIIDGVAEVDGEFNLIS